MNDISDLISVIVPVYNGEKYINRVANSILNQTYENIELLFIPNNCSDNTVELCRKLCSKDSRVKVYINDIKGTLLARKRGVQEAKGEYIVFCDVDDLYACKYAIERMHKDIKEDKSQIIQFGYIRSIFGILRKKEYKVNENKKFAKEEIIEQYSTNVLIGWRPYFDGSMCNKIYQADILKNTFNIIFENINQQEDVLTNFLAFTDRNTNIVTSRKEAYYVYNTGIGISSKETTGIELLKDYRVLKRMVLDRIYELNMNDEHIRRVHNESLWCFRAIISSYITMGYTKEEVLGYINEVNNYEYIRNAKQWFKEHIDYMNSDLKFMCNDYTDEEYYNYCLTNKPKDSFRRHLIRRFKSLLQIYK